MEKDYDEEVEEIDNDYSYEEPTEEEKEQREIEKEQSTQVRKGQVEFKYVNHSERAVKKFKRVSDGDTTKYVNIALEYFGHRCALSGERFETFDKKVDEKKSNLSAEHVVALCLGGDDIVPNLVPTVLQYNLRKNGYYLLDYWDKQKDIDGKSLYSPYRLLKLVNYMMKSIDARDLKTVKEYRKAIMTPNEIDELLAEIEKQDELETDNSKKKIHSDTITATTVDEDNKKILTEVPQVEGNIPTQREQQERFKQNEINMMDIFISDAVGLLNRTQELQQIRLKDKDGNEISLQDKLDAMLKSTIGVIPFEVEVRNAILEKLEALGVQNNKYSVANDLLNNTPILEIAKGNRQNVKLIIEDYIENQLIRIRETQILSEEQLKTIISNMPTILYDEKEMNKIRLWSTYRIESFEELILRKYTATDTLIDALIMLKINGIDLSKIIQSGTIEDLIKEKDEYEQKKIISELQEISEEITEDWPIGARLNTQKTSNINQLKKEIDKSEIILTLEEQKKILEKKEQMSGITIKEFVQVLVVLKTNGIDLSKIVYTCKIEDLIKEKAEEAQNKIINELHEILEEIKKDWPIGVRLSNQKTRNMEQLKKEIDKVGIKLTLEEQQKILEKEENKELSERITREFVQVLVVLKTNGIDLTKIIVSKSTIEDLIKEKDEEEQKQIINELQEISEEITKDWPIGNKLTTQKTRNMVRLKKEIAEAEVILTLEEQQKILERKEQRSGITTKEFVQVLIVLKTNGIDLTKIITGGEKLTIIKDLIKEKDEEEQKQIINELQEISEEITKEWPIGVRLNAQKTRNIVRLKKEIAEAEVILTLEEQQKILERKEQMKGITTREFVQVLIVLKTNGIDLSKIVYTCEIEDLIKEKDEEEQNKIIKELQEISEEITEDWPIGKRLSNQKTIKINQLKKEINNAGLILTLDEQEKVLEKREQMSGTTTREFVQVLVVLKTNGINLSEIVQSGKIEDLIKEKDEEEQNKIIKELQEISEEITEDWPIGKRLQTQKISNIMQLKKEIYKAGIKLTLEEQQKILEKKEQRSRITIREFVQVLVALKTKGIDLSQIVQGGKNKSTIEDLIKEKDEEEQNKIIKELQEISEEIAKDWPIGGCLNNQKTRNMEQLKKEIDKAGIKLTLEEQQKILGKEENKELSERTTREFVQVLVVLKTNGIDLSKIVQSGKIEDLIKEKDEEEQNKIIKELQEISEEIAKDWTIGVRLNRQKTSNIEQLKKEINNVGLILTLEEQQKILEKKEQRSRITIREFVQVLVVLKTNEIDLSKIVQSGKIEDLIKEKDEEEQNIIISELQEILEEITKDWPIGVKLNTQKTNNIDQLKKEIEDAGLEEKLTDKERKKILEKSTKKKVKQTVVEQKNKGELGQNQQIEAEVFEETIRQAEQTQVAETLAR